MDEWEPDPATDAALVPDERSDPAESRNRKIKVEIRDLRGFVKLAESIHANSKGQQLLEGLKKAFEKANELDAPHKAVIFTESLRTQRYLWELLAENGYAGKIALISGANSDAESSAIYRRWLERHKGTDQISGSRTADMKAAIVEEFRDHATILVATESAAEGVNHQFCSLVVNYDLPWNPQRVEQRIGRCHRYGQKHDVVVVNFVNRNNGADQRVFQLLSEKFKLFDGVFGASDEVLGAIESGVDLEKRIAAVYQDCRSHTEIQAAFDQLQLELDDTISNRVAQTRRELLEHFDEEVHQRLRMHRDRAQETLNALQRMLLDLTRQELGPEATFAITEPYFEHGGNGYHMDWRRAEERNCNFYRPDHPLAEKLIYQAKSRTLETAEVCFNYSEYGAKLSAVEPLIGRRGWLRVNLLRVEAFDIEERLLLGGSIGEHGTPPAGEERMHPEICAKILALPGSVARSPVADAAPRGVDEALVSEKAKALAEIERRNLRYFDDEVDKLDRWAEDLKTGLEREIKELDLQMREVKRLSASAPSLQEKLEYQKRLKELDTERRTKRKRLFEAQDEIDAKRDGLIAGIEERLKQKVSFDPLLTIRWTIARE